MSETKQDQQDLVAYALQRLHRQLKERRVLFKPFLSDYDKVGCGNITKTQFFRAVTSINLTLSKEDWKVLAEAYTSRRYQERFEYRTFLQHLNEEGEQSAVATRGLEEETTTASKLTKTIKQETPKELSFDVVLRKLQSVAVRNRLMIDGIFTDFDRLRRGRVTHAEFARAISGIAGLTLTEQEQAVLTDHYKILDPAGYVAYGQFEKDVNAVFMDSNIKNTATRAIITDSDKKESEEDMMLVGNLVEELGYLGYARRILIKPAFTAFDKIRNGCVTERQFKSVIGSYPRVFSRFDWAALLNHYKKGDLGYSYADFVADVTQVEERLAAEYIKDTLQVEAKGNPAKVVTRAIEPALELETVLERLRLEIERQRLDIQDWFADFDQLRKGYVSTTQFRRSLSMRGLDVTDREADVLVATYTIGPDRIDYTSFTNSLHKVSNVRFGASQSMKSSGTLSGSGKQTIKA